VHGVVGNKQVNGAAERGIQTISSRVLSLWDAAIQADEYITFGVFKVMVAEATASYNNKCISYLKYVKLQIILFLDVLL